MKKYYQFPLMALLVAGLGMCVTSCKDDDDNNNNEEQQRQAEQQAEKISEDSRIFYNVMSQLTSIEDAGDNYLTLTFEPTIGMEVKDQPQTRIVASNSLADAAASFNSLTGAEITEETADFTWKNDAVGTLTWHKDGSSCLATVDVNIKQMPHLSQLKYMTHEQIGDNGSYVSCYYRFGDVIKRYRKEDGAWEYWVCVRPAFDPEGKDDCHWITVSPVPASNYEVYEKASNNIYYAVPTKLGLNKKHMQNLAELLFAMNFSQEWFDNTTSYSKENLIGSPTGLPIYNDFHQTKIKYNNRLFFQNVQNYWTKNNIYQKVFGVDNNYFKNNLKKGGLHLLAEGYSWLWTFSNKLSLYQYTYTNGEKEKSNMHIMTYVKKTEDVIKNNIEINVKKLTLDKPYLQSKAFFAMRTTASSSALPPARSWVSAKTMRRQNTTGSRHWQAPARPMVSKRCTATTNTSFRG